MCSVASLGQQASMHEYFSGGALTEQRQQHCACCEDLARTCSCTGRRAKLMSVASFARQMFLQIASVLPVSRRVACGFSDLSHRANLVFKTKNRTGQGKARRGRDSRRNTFDPTIGARVGKEGRGLTSLLHGAGKGIQDSKYVGTKTKTTAFGRFCSCC